VNSAQILKRFKTNCRIKSKRGVMNQWEEEYTKRLDILKTAGEIKWFAWESMKFRLANKTWYTPDFIVLQSDGQIEVHEVKGYWEDDARAKVKVFAELYPLFRVKAFTKRPKRDGGGWKVEEF
jgi:hypothetical protein